MVHEALECLGGNGFVEESILPRLLRESPLNAIWEGSGNVIALDVLRAGRTHPESLEALRQEFGDPVTEVLGAFSDADEGTARLFAERLGVALQASLLQSTASAEVSDLFRRTRIDHEGGRFYGSLPRHDRLRSIVEPAIPE